MTELPDVFWQNIRHICSFKNKDEYDKYLQSKIKEYEQSNNFKTVGIRA